MFGRVLSRRVAGRAGEVDALGKMGRVGQSCFVVRQERLGRKQASKPANRAWILPKHGVRHRGVRGATRNAAFISDRVAWLPRHFPCAEAYLFAIERIETI